jgi:hypothetical protein
MKRLKSDPQWVQQEAEREAKHRASATKLQADLAPEVTSTLQRARHPVLREMLARTLTVREARGVAGRVILAELQRPLEQSPHGVRWALANALTVAADASMAEEIHALIADVHYRDVQERLTTAFKNLADH